VPINAPVTVLVDTSQIKKYVDENMILEKELEQELLHAGFRVAQRGRDKANEAVPIDKGTLQDTIKIIPPIMTADTEGFTYSTGITAGEGLGEYPSVMEFGRTPGRTPPPVDAIEDWLRVKVAQGQFDISGYTGSNPLRRAAFRVARSIGKFGIPGHKFMTDGSDQMHDELEPRLNAVMEKWAAKSETPL